MGEITDAAQMLTINAGMATTDLLFNANDVTFALRFPLVVVPAVGASAGTAPLPPGITLICVDDDASTRCRRLNPMHNFWLILLIIR